MESTGTDLQKNFTTVIIISRKTQAPVLVYFMQKGKVVISSIPQHDERNIFGRSVRLDVLCILGDGRKCNIEVQRSDKDDHLRRIRMNAAVITDRMSQTGEKFEDVIDLIIIYISEFDILKSGKTKYHIDKVVRETGEVINDGLEIILVNTTIDDGSDVAQLMSCMVKKEVRDPKFPILSAEVERLKNTEGGTEAVCEVMKIYEEKARAEGMAEGRKEGLAALVRSLGKVLPSFEDIYKAVVANEEYKDVSREDVFMFYGH